MHVETAGASEASLLTMDRRGPAALPSDSPAVCGERRALWALLASGLLLMLAAAASGEAGFSATRTDRFQATLAAGATVRISNVNGDILASGGRSFTAVATTTVTAPTQDRADEMLKRTSVASTSEEGEYRIETRWPGAEWQGRGRRRTATMGCPDCRILTRYEVTLPAGLAADLRTVNGEVRVKDVNGDLELQNVNGNIVVAGARIGVKAQTVNGRVDASAASAFTGSAWQLQTVNGSVVATLPRDARFDWTASTMSGTIASSFALPPAAASQAPAPPEHRAPRAVIIREAKDGEVLIDAEELAREIEDSLRDGNFEVRESIEWTEKPKAGKKVRRVHVELPQRRYEAKVGGGGPAISASTLNGNVLLLAAGTRESDAKELVSARKRIVVTVPEVEVRMPPIRVRVPPPPLEPPEPPDHDPDPISSEEEADEVVRGDIAGNFLSTSHASYRVGRVSGTVRILTHSGEIHVASAGNGAEIKTYGGDIRLGPVKGDLRAQTLAGDVRVGDVSGSANVETSGGDIRIERVAGAASAITGGGDIVIPSVGGSVQAETGGGEVRIGVLARRPAGGIAIRNAGGDVVLTLPSDFQGNLDLVVDGDAEPDDLLIRSDFPGVAVTRSATSQRASGTLNGGGPKVTVRTTSGSIRLRRGPASGS